VARRQPLVRRGTESGAVVKGRLGSLVRFCMRRGFDRGLLEGNEAWLVVGAAALLAHLAGRVMHREPELVFGSRMQAGETFQITHEARD
jgi:hypothetical protein